MLRQKANAGGKGDRDTAAAAVDGQLYIGRVCDGSSMGGEPSEPSPTLSLLQPQHIIVVFFFLQFSAWSATRCPKALKTCSVPCRCR